MVGKLDKFLMILLVLGMLISLFLVYEHFFEGASEFCTFGSDFDCGIVNRSPYANLDGISYLFTIEFGWPLPLIDISGINWFFDLATSSALWGFLTLLFLFVMRLRKYKKRDFLWIRRESNVKWLRGILIFGMAFGFYLFLVQHFLLQTYCIFCIGLDVVLLLSLILSWVIKE
jgi:uncharacterized membrane protein